MGVYITSLGSISPQNTFQNDFSCSIMHENQSILHCIEPVYKELINPVQLRRMSRILKLGLGASQICLTNAGHIKPDGIVVGTGLACITDLEIFLRSIIDENEQSLSPTPFINSSHNTVAAQIARLLKVQTYNNTHCHRGASFENALLDALMLINEKECEQVLVGGIDEFSQSYYTLLEYDGMWEKSEKGEGAIAGEGAAFFMLSGQPMENSYARISSVKTYYHPKKGMIQSFLAENNLAGADIDAIVLGVNGNKDQDVLYNQQIEGVFPLKTPLLSYKHLCGEYMTSGAFALAITAHALRDEKFPQACVLRKGNLDKLNRVLIYNHYRGQNHSLTLLEKI